MYDEVINKYEIEYSAGGATQNTMRFCQWVVGKNNQVTTFVGAVGNDYFGRIMEKKAKGDGVHARYQVVEDAQTGTCAVLVNNNGKFRSLCAYLGNNIHAAGEKERVNLTHSNDVGASKKFEHHYLLSMSVFIEKAKIVYTSGHMLPGKIYQIVAFRMTFPFLTDFKR